MYDISNLAANIKKCRKAVGLTQTELAKKLFISTQSISKWEIGTSFPDTKNLCMLAEALHVSVDELLRTDCGIRRMFIAIDGGGTKTEFLLFSESGEIIERIVLGSSNPNTHGLKNSLSVLFEGIDSLMSLCPDIFAIHAGIAGCGDATNRDAVSSRLRKKYGSACTISVQSDIINVVYTLENPDKCIVAICGTGSVVYAKNGEDIKRIGGWGYLFDHGGSAYDIGRDGIAAAFSQRDGIGEKTVITELIENELGGSVFSEVPNFYSSGNEYIASFAKFVFEADAMGDKIARSIIATSAERIAELIGYAVKNHGGGSEAIIAGGMIESQAEILFPLIKNSLPNGVQLSLASLPQVIGSAIFALKTQGKYVPELRNTLMSEYVRIVLQNGGHENA